MRTIEALILVLLAYSQKCSAVCSTEYGAEPCKFIPALPGRTPSCARPGLTYCEHPSHYPGQLIQYLIDKWRYDHSTLLSNESPEEFNSYFIPQEAKYGPKPVYGPPNSIHESFPPEPIYIPKPQYPALQQPGNTYIPPPLETHHNYSDGFLGYPDRKPYHSQEQELPSNQLYNYKVSFRPQANYNTQGQFYNHINNYTPINQQSATNYNPNNWWKRHTRDLTKHQSYISERRRRSFKLLKDIENHTNSTPALHRRLKRQSAITGQELCQSRSQYIMPRAALNNQGNWMYVVNMPEVDNRYTQLVKSETCVSQVCSGLCSLPAGYTSRCEQKYVQKRLVALEGSGNNLYTDVFWFPSCCVCTISN